MCCVKAAALAVSNPGLNPGPQSTVHAAESLNEQQMTTPHEESASDHQLMLSLPCEHSRQVQLWSAGAMAGGAGTCAVL